jgi:ribosomal protein L37E
MGKPGMGGDDDDMGGMGGDDDDMGGMGGDDQGDDMGGMGGDDDDMGGMGGGDDLGGMGGDDMGMGGGMDDLGASAKGHVCDKCGHHEADKNAKFCKMCGKGMSKFMKKYMSADGGVSINGKKAISWLDKNADNGEIKQGGRQTGKDMFKTVKGGKKEPAREPNSTGGRVPAVRSKNESIRICGICGSLACEVHNGSTPNADRLNKSFFKSLSGQIGSRGGKFDNGMHDSVVEDALYTPQSKEDKREPFPGEVGYAPNGRIGGFLG